jgi:hypothetical protein
MIFLQHICFTSRQNNRNLSSYDQAAYYLLAKDLLKMCPYIANVGKLHIGMRHIYAHFVILPTHTAQHVYCYYLCTKFMCVWNKTPKQTIERGGGGHDRNFAQKNHLQILQTICFARQTQKKACKNITPAERLNVYVFTC